MTIRTAAPGLALLLLCATAAPAFAADIGTYEQEEDSAVMLWSSAGVAYLEANEYVYAGIGSSDAVSQLIWQSTAPILSAGLDVDMPEGWTLAGKFQFAISGDNYMEDYDWFGPYFVSYDADDWTHRSQHDLTNLDWYVNGSLVLGYDLELGEGTKVNLNGGFKYTDVQWTAFGGSYVYSVAGYRDDVGTWDDDEKGITYRQSFPALVVGADFETKADAWTLSAGIQGGFTISGTGDDHHWMRDLNFVDNLGPAPLLGATASAGYAIADGTTLFIEGSVEKIFVARGDTDVFDIPTGIQTDFYEDQAGGDFFAASLSLGVTGSFY